MTNDDRKELDDWDDKGWKRMTGINRDDQWWSEWVEMTGMTNDDEGLPGMTMEDLKDDKGWPGMTRADRDD